MGIAAERIDRLADLASQAAADGDLELASRYAQRASRIAERHRLSLPSRLTRFTCETCGSYLVPGRNARVRTRDGHVVITCECGSQSRYPYDDR
ncbi:MAG: ribonuclease P protein component 4 [Halobacteriales archaeon]